MGMTRAYGDGVTMVKLSGVGSLRCDASVGASCRVVNMRWVIIRISPSWIIFAVMLEKPLPILRFFICTSNGLGSAERTKCAVQ